MSNRYSIFISYFLSTTAVLNLICLLAVLFPANLQAQLDVTFGDIEEPGCFGLPGGSVRAVAVSGTAPYAFTWSDGTTGAVLENVFAGTYSVTVVDADAGIASRSITILQPELLNLEFEVQECSLPLSITALPDGGVGPYKYQWSTGESSSTITANPNVEYCLTVTDQNNCGKINCVTLEFNPLAVDVTVNEITCPGAEDGSLTATPVGGTLPVTYEWSNGATTQNITDLAAGTYTVTATDAKGCTATANGTVAPKAAIEIGLIKTDPTCTGATDGSITSSVAGGTPPYTYEWNNGETSPNLANLSPGTYEVTVTDAKGCPEERTITLEYQSEISIGVAPTPETCPGANDGFLTVTVNYAVSPYTYAWSDGRSTQVLSGVTPGTYIVTVTDAVGCQDIDTATVKPAPDLVLEVESTAVAICEGANGSATVTSVNGIGPFTYLWSNGASSASIEGLVAGTYSVTVTTPNNCIGSTNVTISEPPPLLVAVTGTDLICPDEANGSAIAGITGGTAPFSFVWSNGASDAGIDNLTAGFYTVTVTDAAACTATAGIVIEEAPAMDVTISGTPIVCGAGNTGTARALVAGVTGPFSFEWSTGANTQGVTGLGTGTYTVTVTDVLGCTDEAEFSIRVIDDLNLSFNTEDVHCAGNSTGSAIAAGSGGEPPYTYTWSTGASGPAVSGLSAGGYTVTLTDIYGCTTSETVQISEPEPLNAELTVLDPFCINDETGTIDLALNGGTPPFSFTWTTGATTQNISDLAAGTYSVTITDANDCSIVRTGIVNDPPAIQITGTVLDVLCFGEENGAIDITISEGTPPYTFEWTTGAVTEDLSNLAAGTYALTVADDNGCIATASFTVSEPLVLSMETLISDVSCNDGSDGSIDITVNGGSPPYTFEWSDGTTEEDLINAPAGTYTVIVTDANGCTVSATGTISEPTALVCSIDQLSDVILGEDGALEVTVEEGTSPYTYSWSSGQTTPLIDGLDGGTYTVTVTDANGCTTSCSFGLVALSGLGDFTWEDLDRDGIQDDTEPPLSGLLVRLKNADGLVIDSTTTDMNGFYSFIGLEPGTYAVQFVGPEGFNVTQLNIGDDALDSDADSEMNKMTETVTLAPGEFNPTLDAGFYNPPEGAITDPCSCLNNSTTEEDGQFLEIVTIRSYPGETWTIVDQMNMFIFDSEAPPIPPIPVPLGTELHETEEPGVYEYTFKLMDDFTYTIYATNGLDTLSFSNTCTYPVVNATEIPSEPICVSDDPIALSANPSVPGTVNFYINGEEVTVFDPSEYGLGDFDLLVEFTPDNPNECITTIVDEILIVDDCFAKIGDLAWHDQDRDGLQGNNEPGIEGVKVTVTGLNESDGYLDMMMTDENGGYLFMVPPGTYKVTFEQPQGFLPTDQNAGEDDELDSDADPDMLMTQIVTVLDEEMNLTLDAGFFIPPTLAISDPCTCLNNSTNENDGQFSEVLTIESNPGETWTILENSNMFLTSSPPPPPEPIPVPIGTQLVEVAPGVYEYPFILVDELLYSTIATNGIDTLSISNICTYPTVNVNQLPSGDICVDDPSILLNATPSEAGTVRFYLNGEEITELDPSILEVDTYELLVEFTPEDPSSCIATIYEEININNDCQAKLGDYVWYDKNENGIQDANENGISGVQVTLTEVGVDNPSTKMTTTDHTGMYMFLVPPGDYKVTFEQPENYSPTLQNSGADDSLDSDMDPVMLMTQVVTLVEGEMNLTLDAGFVRECVNVTDPGAIGYDQYLCGPGNDAEPFESLSPATGGEGVIEYLWMYSTEEGAFNAATWTIIPNSNTLTYDPGVIYETTRFARCARREGCPGFLETTIVEVLVGNEAQGEIFGQSTICVGEVATYEAVGVSDEAQVEWNFGSGAQPRGATGQIGLVKFTSFGTFTIEMIVTENDCVSTYTKRILVTNNPAACGEGLIINAEIMDKITRTVEIDWEVEKGTLMRYTIEHSEDGEHFAPLGELQDPTGSTVNELQYAYTTTASKQGHNFYRVKMTDEQGNEWYSNIEEVIFFNQSRLALLYPNPTPDIAVLEIFESYGEDIFVELIDAAGKAIQTWEEPAGSKRIEMDLTYYAGGVYFLRIRFGDTNVKAIRLVKH